VVHNRTALPQTEGLFIGAFERLHPEHRNIQLELVRINTFSSAFPRDPHRYRLVATTNLFGDILSDQAFGLAGGVGIAPSLNTGGEHAMAQAVHGTAPDIAGKGIANPAALILSTALLVLPEDRKRGLSRDRADARARRPKCDRQRHRNSRSRGAPAQREEAGEAAPEQGKAGRLGDCRRVGNGQQGSEIRLRR
jgi:hypothetical protein